MHNVRRFLQDAVFEPSQEARARAAAEGNARPEDMIPIYRKRTTIDSSGRETEMQTRCAWRHVVAIIHTTRQDSSPHLAGTLSWTARKRSRSSALTPGIEWYA